MPPVPTPSLNGHAKSNGKAVPSRTKLTPKHRDDLRASGLSDATIAACQFRSLTTYEEVFEALRWDGYDGSLGHCLAIPRRDPMTGNVNGQLIQIKPDNPRTDENGKPRKYECPKGVSSVAFFPPATVAVLTDATIPLIFTEGAKKAAKADQEGFPCVGLTGVWGWIRKREKDANGKPIGPMELIDDLAGIPLQERLCYIGYDSDVVTKEEVQYAERCFGDVLKSQGAADVIMVRIPSGPDGAKMGLDDYLTAHGPEALRQLLNYCNSNNSFGDEESNYCNSNNSFGADPKAINVIKIIPPTLGEAAYLGFLGEFLRDVAGYTEATDAGVLAHLLPAIGTLIGPSARIFAGAYQQCRINSILVGPTATGRKGTAYVPVELLMKDVNCEFWKRQCAGGLSSGEGLIKRVADRVTKDEDGNDVIEVVEKRLFVMEPEFSKLLANTQRQGNVVSQLIREAFDSGELETMTMNPMKASGAHISIVAHITPEELSERFSSIDMANGFGNRFLWFAVKSEKMMPKTEPIPQSLFRKFAPRLRTIALGMSASGVPHGVMVKDSEAEKWWEGVYASLHVERPGFVGSLTSRGPPLILRMAMIYAIAESKPRIGVEHLCAAKAVWDYSVASVQQLFSKKVANSLDQKILTMLDDGAKGRTELKKQLSEQQKSGFDKAIEMLEKAKLVKKKVQKHEGAGRPAEMWERV